MDGAGRLLRAKLAMADVSSPFADGTERLLKKATTTLAQCQAKAAEHHASQKEEDDANAALSEATDMFDALTEKLRDEVTKRNRAVMDYDHVVSAAQGQRAAVDDLG